MFGRLWRGIRWVASGPVQAFPGAAIARNGQFIGRLWRLVRVGPQADTRLHLHEDRSIDLTATAFAHGISIAQLEARLATRRRETARAAYLSFGMGWAFFGLWALRAATMPWTPVHVLPLLEFMPFCAIFFLLAFRSGLQNFQVRTRTPATAGQYLATSEPFWPS